MAAEVSSFSRMAKVCMEEAEEGTELVTRDLLGSAASASPEVDLELQIPAGWDSCLDLSEFVFDDETPLSFLALIREVEVAGSSQGIPTSNRGGRSVPRPDTFTSTSTSLPPSPSSAPQRLKSPPAFSISPDLYHSVCILEKVKSVLERESRVVVNTSPPFAPRSLYPPPPSLSSATTITITTCSSTTESRPAAEQHEDSFESTCGRPAMAVAACPGCLLYVLICKADPRCLKCAVSVPINHLNKKPRIDLNFSLRNGGGGEHQRRHEDE